MCIHDVRMWIVLLMDGLTRHLAHNVCAAKGYDQCLWVFGDKHIVTEAGTMNFFMYWKNENGM